MVNTYLAASAAVLSSSPSKKGIISESLSSVNEGIRASNLGRNVSLTWRYLGHTSESVSHPLFVVDHSVYRSSALARSMFVYVFLSLSLDHGHLICIWRGFVFL